MIQTLIVAAIVLFAVWQLVSRFRPRKAAAPDAGCGPGSCDTCGACKAFTRPDPPQSGKAP